VLVHEPQEDPVALPLLQGGELPLADPGQLTLVAVLRRAGEARGVEQVHILGRVDVGDEGHKPAVAVLRERQPRFLQHLAADAVLRAFPVLKFSADADPFVVIFVVLLFYAVEHQILSIALKIAERRLLHAPSLPCVCFLYCIRGWGKSKRGELVCAFCRVSA